MYPRLGFAWACDYWKKRNRRRVEEASDEAASWVEGRPGGGADTPGARRIVTERGAKAMQHTVPLIRGRRDASIAAPAAPPCHNTGV